MPRAAVIIPDLKTFDRLWTTGQFAPMFDCDLRIVLTDALYDRLTSDPSDRTSSAVKTAIDSHQPPFVVTRTRSWRKEAENRRQGREPSPVACEFATVEFFAATDGLKRHLAECDPVVILFEEPNFSLKDTPERMHLIPAHDAVEGLRALGALRSASPAPATEAAIARTAPVGSPVKELEIEPYQPSLF